MDMDPKKLDKIVAATIAKAVKEQRKIDRANKAAEKEALKIAKQNKPKKTEADIVRAYAKTIMDKQATRGMLRKEFADLQKNTPTKDLWLQTDFFFSVVFQSRHQKYLFLDFLMENFKITSKDDGVMSIQVINGLKLAESMGLDLPKEVANDYQPSNLELRDLILDV